LRYAALVTNPWRLTLLFFVSGVALRFMSRRRAPVEVLRARLVRLAPPFLFGVLVLVPPQSWIEAMDKGTWTQGLGPWWLSQFSPQGFVAGIPLNHIWFVLYISVYSLIVVGLLALPKIQIMLERAFAWVFGGWRLWLIPMVYLAVVRQNLFATFGLSNHLTTDWYNHAASFGVFLLGFQLALRDKVWADFERLRWLFLGTAICALPALIVLEADPNAMLVNGGLLKNITFAVDQWATIGAVLGFASRHIRTADGPLLRYLTDAVFPCYLAHQTLLVIAVWILKPLGLPVAVEASSLLIFTLGGSLLVYEIVRRIGPIRPLWGLKPFSATKGVG
jgi:glucans biosynthesis protein C